MAQKFKIKKGDQVIVTTGRDKGRRGEVIEVLRSEGRVLVQGCNMVQRHTARRRRLPVASSPRKHRCIFRMLLILTLTAARQRVLATRSGWQESPGRARVR